MNDAAEDKGRRRGLPVSAWTRVVLGTAVGVALLYLLFRGTDWATVWHAVAHMSLFWFLAAQVAGWASYFTRAQRWRSIVNATCRVPYRPVCSATQVGQLFNLTPIPRVGELIRVFVLARLTPVSFSRAFSTATLDRVTDLLALLALILLSLLAFPTHRDIVVPGEYLGVQGELTIPLLAVRTGAVTLGIIVGVGLLGLIVLYARRRWLVGLIHRILHPFSARLAGLACRLFDEFGEGLHVFRSARDLAATLFWAAVTWTLTVLTVECVLLAFHLPHPWYASSLMTALVATLLMVNVAPGFVGQFHLAIIGAIVLTSPETPPAEARAVAIVTHLCAIYPTVILGVWALSHEHLRAGELMGMLQRKPNDGKPAEGNA